MKSWYRLAQSKPRQFEFDNAENVFYKVLEQQEPFEEDDILRVYHAFRDMNDAIMTTKHGLSGQSATSRVYSYESNNNPKGLFVTTDFNTSKDFTSHGAIIEFQCKFSELEIPVWPGGGYTVQGQMAEYWEWDKLDEQRQEAILKQREKAKESEYPAVANSSRPELAEMLMSPREYQALFIGDLNANRIDWVWVRDSQQDYARIDDPWKEMSTETFLETYEYQKQKAFSGEERMSDQHMDIERKIYMPEDNFDPTTFLQKLSEDHGYSAQELMDIIKGWSLGDAVDYLKAYIWPKQENSLQQWLQTVFQ